MPSSSSVVVSYSFHSNGSLVLWCNSVFTMPLPSNRWFLLLSYSVMSQRFWESRFLVCAVKMHMHISRCSRSQLNSLINGQLYKLSNTEYGLLIACLKSILIETFRYQCEFQVKR
jgi:hypothetical protein